MDHKQFQSFSDFWPFYLGEHKLTSVRALHYLGTITSHLFILICIWWPLWRWLPLALVLGYGPAWFAHFMLEKNRPATFKHPLWSLMGDYKMLYLASTGQLKTEISGLEKN